MISLPMPARRRSMTLALVVTACLVAALGTTEADACGGWTLEDRELGVQVTFLASTVYTQPRGGVRKDVIRIDDDGTPAGVRSHSVAWKAYTPPSPVHRFEGTALLLRDERVGELHDDGFTIHGRRYAVATTLVPPGTGANVGPLGDDAAWIVDVKVDGATILTGLGRSICPGERPKPPEAIREELMKRRLAIYLASTRTELTKPAPAPPK